jgi:predicted DsbA family dithiol-disulfide isomerase
MNMVVHPQAVQMAHQYGCAAGKQNHFIEYKHAFWDKGFGPYMASQGQDKSALGPENILKFSAEIPGIDVNKLKADAESPDCQKRVQEDMAELSKFRVNGTPGFFINGKFIGGGIPKQAFKQAIDEKLKIAEASGVPGDKYYDTEIMGKGVHEFRSKKQGGGASQ